MQIIRTERTYKDLQNAERALSKALVKVGLARDEVRYVIGAVQAEDGSTRFAPAVIMPSGEDTRIQHAVNNLMFIGVTIFN